MTSVLTPNENGGITVQHSTEGAKVGRWSRKDSGQLPDRCYTCIDPETLQHRPATGYTEPMAGILWGACDHCTPPVPARVRAVYFTAGPVLDAYTVVITYMGQDDIYMMSHDADMPNGVNTYAGTEAEYIPMEHESRLDNWESAAPVGVILGIGSRLASYQQTRY